MTLKEFYNFALNAAKDRGFQDPHVDVISASFRGEAKHSCQLWLPKKAKYLRTNQHGSPDSALQEFKDLIDLESKTYSELSEDIEL